MKYAQQMNENPNKRMAIFPVKYSTQPKLLLMQIQIFECVLVASCRSALVVLKTGKKKECAKSIGFDSIKSVFIFFVFVFCSHSIYVSAEGKGKQMKIGRRTD